MASKTRNSHECRGTVVSAVATAMTTSATAATTTARADGLDKRMGAIDEYDTAQRLVPCDATLSGEP